MNPSRRSALLTLFSLLAVATSAAHAQQGPLFEFIPTSESGVAFRNDIVDNQYFNIINYVNAYNGSGVAVGDLNGDSLPDLYFVGTQVGSRMYFNRGNFQFEDVTEAAGTYDSGAVFRGVQMVDIDGDGDLDIFTCKTLQPNRVWINDGRGTFVDQAKKFGLDYAGYSTQAAFFDYDRDGDLDLYLVIAGGPRVTTYARNGSPDRLYRNDRGTFVDVSKEAGITDNSYGLNINIADLNSDGWPDVYITNDFEGRDAYYLNQRNGTFRNVQSSHLGHTSNSAMGSDIADFNNDGLPDIFADDMLPVTREREHTMAMSVSVLSSIYDSSQVMRNTLQLNRGDGVFSEIAQLSGVEASEWSWGALMQDYDLDGWRDLVVVNGIRRDMTEKDHLYRVVNNATPLDVTNMMMSVRLKNVAFRNNRDLTFSRIEDEWGLGGEAHSNSLVQADLDNDGDLDLILNNIDTTAFIYRNMAVEQKRGNWVQFRLHGAGANTFGLGAKVEVITDGSYQMEELQTARGYLGSVDPLVSLGLAGHATIDTLRVTWVGGARQVLTNVAANRRIDLFEKDATIPRSHKRVTTATLFRSVDSTRGIPFRHYDNIFDDLRHQRMLPQRLSQSGPGLAVGDVNGDGLEDIFVGRGLFFPGGFMLQTKKGAFVPSTDTAAFVADKDHEDMGSLLFDADGDSDLDLYVVSGGFEMEANDPRLRDRLYLNDGRGRFTRSLEALPADSAGGSCVVAADYDSDGDMDLFVGGRVVPGAFPLADRSRILRNDGGRFVDVTEQACPAIAHVGMTSGAIWTDYDNDGRPDLLVTGLYMAPRLFRNMGEGRFEERAQSDLSGFSGWWTGVVAADVDNDGDMDYVMGNLGTNWRFAPKPGRPVRFYYHDFDGNGSRDLVQVRIEDGVEYPFVDRMVISEQMPYIRQRYNTWKEFSTARLDDFIPRDSLNKAFKVEGTWFQSSWIENRGDDRFAVHALPAIAQVAPIFGIDLQDFDGDGTIDIMAVGNYLDGPEPHVQRFDANIGLLLAGDGRGTFREIPHETSGLNFRGDGRGLALLRYGTGNTLYHVIGSNRNVLGLYSFDASKRGGRLLTLKPSEMGSYGIVTMKNGSKRRVEFACGSGYLTCSSPTIIVSPQMESMTLYRGSSVVRDIRF